MVEMATTSLNDLPDQLLLHILSLLPTTSTAVTSLISRKWRNLWLSTPSLNFYHITHVEEPQSLKLFADFVEEILIRRPQDAPLHTLDVAINFNRGLLNSRVTYWIRYAVSHNVENLELRILSLSGVSELSAAENPNDRFEFPFYVLRDSRVRVLKLSCCNLSSLPSENRRFDMLRSVTLEAVRLTDQVIADLVVASGNLESLVLTGIKGCNDIKIYSSNLTELTIEFIKLEEGSVDIAAPNLRALDINCCHIGDFVLSDASSLVEAVVNVEDYHYWVNVMSSLGHVKRLHSPNIWFEIVDRLLAEQEASRQGIMEAAYRTAMEAKAAALWTQQRQEVLAGAQNSYQNEYYQQFGMSSQHFQQQSFTRRVDVDQQLAELEAAHRAMIEAEVAAGVAQMEANWPSLWPKIRQHILEKVLVDMKNGFFRKE